MRHEQLHHLSRGLPLRWSCVTTKTNSRLAVTQQCYRVIYLNPHKLVRVQVTDVSFGPLLKLHLRTDERLDKKYVCKRVCWQA